MTMDKVRSVDVEITGIRPLLMHRRPYKKEEVERLDELVSVLKKDATNEKAYTEEAEIGTYKNKKGYFIPSDWLETMLEKHGSSIRIDGQGKKTYKDLIKSMVVIEPEEISLNPQKYELHRKFVKIGRSQIMRTRAQFNDWSAKFKIQIMDNTIPIKVVKELLETGGKVKGIGDWRPKYGMFVVKDFKADK